MVKLIIQLVFSLILGSIVVISGDGSCAAWPALCHKLGEEIGDLC